MSAVTRPVSMATWLTNRALGYYQDCRPLWFLDMLEGAKIKEATQLDSLSWRL